MTRKIENADNILNQQHFECRLDQVPCTVQSTYTKFGKEDVLVSRELKLLPSEKVILGVGYDNQGNPVEMYTYDAKGQKVDLCAKEEKKNKALPNLIEERLNSVTRTLAKEKAKEVTNPTVEKTNEPKKVKTVQKNIQPNRGQHSL